MKIIETLEDINTLAKELKDKNFVVNRFYIQGPLQKNHHQIINRLKEECDFLIVQYNEFFDFVTQLLGGRQYKPRFTYTDIELSVYLNKEKVNDNIDCLVINRLPEEKEKLDKIAERLKSDYLIMKDECKRLNLSNRIGIEAMFVHFTNYVNYVSNRIGPKSILQLLLHRKCFSKVYKQYPERSVESIIKDGYWIFHKDEDGTVSSRSGSTAFTFLRDRVYQSLLQGMTKFKDFKKIAIAPMLVDYHFTLLDLFTLERIDEINDNCAFVFSSFAGTNFIFIKDGGIIY